MKTTRHTTIQITLMTAIVFLAMWFATQWAASALKFHPRLGAPWLDLFGAKLYAPWHLFPWWLSFGRQAPRVFDTAGLIALAGGVAAGLIGMGVALWRGSHDKVVTTYGSARWAEDADIRAAGLTGAQGVILGQIDDHYLRDDGPHHVLAVAPTRSGKGVGLVVPTLLSWTGPAVIHDIKGENWQLTSGWRHSFSHCLKFDPTDPQCARFNPLNEVRKGLNEVRDVQNIADILIDPNGGLEHETHWHQTANELLCGVILHVLYAEADKSLACVARLLADPARPLSELLAVMLSTNHIGTDDAPCVHPTVATKARAVMNKALEERSGVISTAVRLLSIYSDPIVAAATAVSDWSVSDLMATDRIVSLYLVVPPSDLSRTRPLMRLVLNQIARRLTERLAERVDSSANAPQPRPLLLMLDEFPALGRLDFFEASLAFLAGYGIRAVLIAQSLNQIEKAYGANNSIMDNCHVRIAFAANDERTAKRLSDALGTKTELRTQRNLAGKRLSPWLANTSISEQETSRALLTPGEVMQLPADEAIVLVSGTPPIRAKKLRYFADQNFLDRCAPPVRACGVNRQRRRVLGTAGWGHATRTEHPTLRRAFEAVEAGRAAATSAPPPPPIDITPPKGDADLLVDRPQPLKRRAKALVPDPSQGRLF
jgi:type IV secretion system protein VirD4